MYSKGSNQDTFKSLHTHGCDTVAVEVGTRRFVWRHLEATRSHLVLDVSHCQDLLPGMKEAYEITEE